MPFYLQIGGAQLICLLIHYIPLNNKENNSKKVVCGGHGCYFPQTDNYKVPVPVGMDSYESYFGFLVGAKTGRSGNIFYVKE